MNITIKEYQDYLYDHYKDGGIDQSLFMKLVEEIGEVAEVIRKPEEKLPKMKTSTMSWVRNWPMQYIMHWPLPA